MRALTRAEAVQLALADADAAARKRRKLKKYFARADRIVGASGWIPWWERGGLFGNANGLPPVRGG